MGAMAWPCWEQCCDGSAWRDEPRSVMGSMQGFPRVGAIERLGPLFALKGILVLLLSSLLMLSQGESGDLGACMQISRSQV